MLSDTRIVLVVLLLVARKPMEKPATAPHALS